MKALLVVLISMLTVFQMNAQRVCGTVDYSQQLITADPSLRNAYNIAEAQIAAFTKNTSNILARDTAANEIIYIPVVIHILYKTADQNLPLAQVISQLTVLNDDYGHTNADRINTPAVFAAVAADTRIRFCLAQIDPQGRRTTGIIRKFTNTDGFTAQDGMKYSAQGGDDAWDSKHYLNIWVCKMTGRTLGYSSVPGGPAAADGVVIGYDVFGTEGNVRSPFNKGRTATHEVGHWLGLKHIWGDAICGSDDVDDTPTQQYYNYGSPTFPHMTNCSPNSNGAMFMNFMDFTDDATMNMFTIGQKNRMRALFAKNNLHNSFLSSFACDSTLVQNAPLPVADTTVAVQKAATVPQPVEVKVTFSVKIYPNPARSFVTIEYSNAPGASLKTFNVFNVTGNKVFSGQLVKEKTTLNIDHLPAGIYFIRIESGTNSVTSKIIKE